MVQKIQHHLAERNVNVKEQVKSVRLAQIRVTGELHEKLLAVCEAQEMSMAEVRRAALAEYVRSPVKVRVPVVGQIVPDEELGNKIVLFSDRFGLTEKGEAYLRELENEAA